MKRLNFFSFIMLFLLITVFNSYCFSQNKENNTQKVKNIILLIGDGMGVSQIYAGMTVKQDAFAIEQCPVIGFAKTYSADNYVTDSAASGTAIATGTKTNNGAIGVDTTGTPVKSILEYAEDNGLSTGLVSTSSITHATPASFIAHQPSRMMQNEIAADFLKTDIDVFIGGGLKFFRNIFKGENILKRLKEKDYKIIKDTTKLMKTKSKKIAALLAKNHLPRYSDGRGNMLPKATQKAIDCLKDNPKGFFLMVEGSQIDWGGHGNDLVYTVEETLDFDRAVQVAIDFAVADGNTLVIVTSDHECGGLALTGGNFETGRVEAIFPTKHHTGVMVPVFVFGPNAGLFTGIYENTAIFDKMMKAYGFKK